MINGSLWPSSVFDHKPIKKTEVHVQSSDTKTSNNIAPTGQWFGSLDTKTSNNTDTDWSVDSLDWTSKQRTTQSPTGQLVRYTGHKNIQQYGQRLVSWLGSVIVLRRICDYGLLRHAGDTEDVFST